jgi:hypothetical protein
LFHPHIVGVYDRGEFDGRLWISMDYVEGTDVAQLMRGWCPDGMPTDEALTMSPQSRGLPMPTPMPAVATNLRAMVAAHGDLRPTAGPSLACRRVRSHGQVIRAHTMSMSAAAVNTYNGHRPNASSRVAVAGFPLRKP